MELGEHYKELDNTENKATEKVKRMNLDTTTREKALYEIRVNYNATKMHLKTLHNNGFDTGRKIFSQDEELSGKNEDYTRTITRLHNHYYRMILIPIRLKKGTFNHHY